MESSLPATESRNSHQTSRGVRLGIKIRLPRNPPQNFVQLGSPRQKYSMSWKLGNIGWIGLKDCPGYPVSLIRKTHLRKESEDVSTLAGTDHPNLVNLVEAFYDKSIYLVYQFHGFAVDLGRVCSRPNAEFSKGDIAKICKNTLQGLEYIHDVHNIAHGDLSLSNIVLHQDGQVRIANIGNSFLKKCRDKRKDLKGVGIVIARLSDPSNILRGDIENVRNVSPQAKDFISRLSTASYATIFEHKFLEPALSDGNCWTLIPHFMNTIGFMWPLPVPVHMESEQF